MRTFSGAIELVGALADDAVLGLSHGERVELVPAFQVDTAVNRVAKVVATDPPDAAGRPGTAR